MLNVLVISCFCGTEEVSSLIQKLRVPRCSVRFKQFSEAEGEFLRRIEFENFDVVFIALPKTIEKSFYDFFKNLRKMCSIVPIVGVKAYSSGEGNNKWGKFRAQELDDIIDPDIEISDLIKRLDLFAQAKGLMQMNLFDLLCKFNIDATSKVFSRAFLDDYLLKHTIMERNTAIFMIDIDEFKQVNDKYGHTFGDRGLQHISEIIKSCIRPSDMIARYGGDEFIIIMQDIDRTATISIADRIKNCVASTRFNGVQFTVSVGVHWTQNRGITHRDAISIADKFMYMAKQKGGNGVKISA